MAKRTPKALPEPGGRERSAIRDAAQRTYSGRPRVSVSLKQGTDNAVIANPPHNDKAGWGARLHDAFGTTSADFTSAEISRLMNAFRGTAGDPRTEMQTNAALAAIDGIRPRDEIEAMLVAQMAVTHSLAMELVGRAHRAEMIPQLEGHTNLAAKMMRTYTAQVEALAKLRRGGEQKVRVEHVHVHPGAQAIVGNVTHQGAPGGGGGIEDGGQPHGPTGGRALAHTPAAPMWSPDPQREPLPATRGEGEEPL